MAQASIGLADEIPLFIVLFDKNTGEFVLALSCFRIENLPDNWTDENKRSASTALHIRIPIDFFLHASIFVRLLDYQVRLFLQHHAFHTRPKGVRSIAEHLAGSRNQQPRCAAFRSNLTLHSRHVASPYIRPTPCRHAPFLEIAIASPDLETIPSAHTLTSGREGQAAEMNSAAAKMLQGK